jgi:hypothetical protein
MPLDGDYQLWTSSVTRDGVPWTLNRAGGVTTDIESATPPKDYSGVRPYCVRGGKEVDRIVNGDVVFDPNTGLEWQREIGDVPAMSLKCALAYCAVLSADPSRPFRVPSIKELSTIVVGSNDPAVDLALFPDTPSGEFMSSTIAVGTPGDADILAVGLASTTETSKIDGTVFHYPAGYISGWVDHRPSLPDGALYVRCVR